MLRSSWKLLFIVYKVNTPTQRREIVQDSNASAKRQFFQKINESLQRQCGSIKFMRRGLNWYFASITLLLLIQTMKNFNAYLSLWKNFIKASWGLSHTLEHSIAFIQWMRKLLPCDNKLALTGNFYQCKKPWFSGRYMSNAMPWTGFMSGKSNTIIFHLFSSQFQKRPKWNVDIMEQYGISKEDLKSVDQLIKSSDIENINESSATKNLNQILFKK